MATRTPTTTASAMRTLSLPHPPVGAPMFKVFGFVRRVAGVSIEELAASSGIAQKKIADYENADLELDADALVTLMSTVRYAMYKRHAEMKREFAADLRRRVKNARRKNALKLERTMALGESDPDTVPQYLTLQELATQMRVTVQHVHFAQARGAIATVRFGQAIRVERAEAIRVLREGFRLPFRGRKKPAVVTVEPKNLPEKSGTAELVRDAVLA